MKKHIFLILLLFCGVFSYAQNGFDTTLELNWRKSIDQILLLQTPKLANKTTQLQQRLIAMADSVSTGTAGKILNDSMKIGYSSLNSVYNLGTQLFQYTSSVISTAPDTNIIFRYVNGVVRPTERDIVYRDTFFGQGYDTATHTFINGTKTFWINNAANNKTAQHQYIWNGSSWMYSSRSVFLYNANNQLISDTTYHIILGNQYLYAYESYRYDAFGNKDTVLSVSSVSSTANYAKYTYIYANNLLKESVYATSLNGTLFVNYSRDSFSYTNSVRTYSKNYRWNLPAPGWNWRSSFMGHLNSGSLIDTYYYSYIDPLLNAWGVNRYNTYGNMVENYQYSATQTMIAHRLYYYETYDNPNKVSEVFKKGNIILYPNPSISSLNIKRDEFISGEYVVIWNAQGQKVATQKLDNTQLATIPIQALRPGMYWLTLHSADGSLSARKSFVKQ